MLLMSIIAVISSVINFLEVTNLNLESKIINDSLSRLLLIPVTLTFLYIINKRWYFIFPFIICSSAVVMNFNKQNIVNYLFTIGITIILFYMYNKKNKFYEISKNKIKIYFITLTFLLINIFVIYRFNESTGGYIQNTIIENMLKKRVEGLKVYQGDITGGRLDMWSKSIEVWLEKPLFGHGMGKVIYFYSFGWNKKNELHNYPLQLLQNVGLIGTLFLLINLFLWIRISNKKIKKIKNNHTKIGLTALMVYIFVTLFNGLFAHSLASPPLSILFWISISILSVFTIKNKYLYYKL